MIKDGGPKESEQRVTRQVKVFSSIAVQSALEALVPPFEKAEDCRLDIAWNTAPALVKRLQGGETADVLILNRAGMDAMIRDGRALAGSEATLASSATALAVKAGRRGPTSRHRGTEADAAGGARDLLQRCQQQAAPAASTSPS